MKEKLRKEASAKPEAKAGLWQLPRAWRRGVIAMALVSMLLIAGAAAGARLLGGKPVDSAAVGGKSKASVRASLRSSSTAQARDGAHSVMLRSTGFEPDEMTRPVGRFTLAVDKESIREEVVMQLSSDDGTFSEQYTVPADAPNWYRRIQLQQGSYRITVVNHPWTCHITIQ